MVFSILLNVQNQNNQSTVLTKRSFLRKGKRQWSLFVERGETMGNGQA